ncbi:MAG TPA: hypothetical protein DCG19_08455 [Cryomorphaceae bacterium]|nr:hypothetical protein [Owenweeksia sp.]MBF98669.1 hypothetical protein [Owenweeksia sp.]HAD97425.1 hypothetical protein [Cryomorphaceae bacterium]HBF20445.1 hypothetical protein [Cryomorphaceae bacterium]
MKKLTFLLVLAGMVGACSKNDNETDKPGPGNTSLEGQYQLVEILADPGDGSGTFEPVNSTKMVMLYADGTVKSNGDICTMVGATDSATQGTYSLTDSSITVTNCSKLFFEQNSSQLIINYPCIEACRAKYKKIPLATVN